MLPRNFSFAKCVVFLKSVKSGMLPQTGISFVSAASALCWLTHLAPMPSEQGIPKISDRPRQRVPLIPPWAQGRECRSFHLGPKVESAPRLHLGRSLISGTHPTPLRRPYPTQKPTPMLDENSKTPRMTNCGRRKTR
jgi:hypothetical protein